MVSSPPSLGMFALEELSDAELSQTEQRLLRSCEDTGALLREYEREQGMMLADRATLIARIKELQRGLGRAEKMEELGARPEFACVSRILREGALSGAAGGGSSVGLVGGGGEENGSLGGSKKGGLGRGGEKQGGAGRTGFCKSSREDSRFFLI